MISNGGPGLHGWSPDGKHILATLYCGREEGEMTLLSVEDGSKKSTPPRAKGEPEFVALSPDGHHLGYGEEDDIIVRPVSGGDAVTVANGPSKDILRRMDRGRKPALFQRPRPHGRRLEGPHARRPASR